MVGNVWEWTSSHYSEGSGNYVLRGGSFVNWGARSSYQYRNDLRSYGRTQSLGFRLAGEIP